jgi:hypothetical protein
MISDVLLSLVVAAQLGQAYLIWKDIRRQRRRIAELETEFQAMIQQSNIASQIELEERSWAATGKR